MSFRSGPAKRPLVLLGRGDNAALSTFHRALGSALTKAGIGLRLPPRFTPHVTLIYAERGVDEQAVDAIGWTVREFVLVDSLLGKTRHVPLGRWPLRG